MKKLLMTTVLATIILVSCKEETTPTAPTPTAQNYSIEGMWLIEGISSTAYIFQDGLQYTVYCTADPCDWDAVTIKDAIPNPHDYTLENDTLEIDLNFGNISRTSVQFACDGNVLKRTFETGSEGRWYRPSYDISNCDE